jgi:hypothetical protein
MGAANASLGGARGALARRKQQRKLDRQQKKASRTAQQQSRASSWRSGSGTQATVRHIAWTANWMAACRYTKALLTLASSLLCCMAQAHGADKGGPQRSAVAQKRPSPPKASQTQKHPGVQRAAATASMAKKTRCV